MDTEKWVADKCEKTQMLVLSTRWQAAELEEVQVKLRGEALSYGARKLNTMYTMGYGLMMN